ncbi:hypothetical protein LIER_36834 [Lithospermum erythrorhizon]|uniref:Retrotransposon gag domain-containing protein n=1 Tax=Lithospermum erythrorhizon TaxID=34254 RepID=A0AAV3PE24_LITER
MPKLRIFYGMGDPSNQLKYYDSQLSFWASVYDVYARAFLGSLSGATLKWFHKLPPNSIDCWQDTVDLFMDKFGASIVTEKDEEVLMNLKQKPREALRSYANLWATKIEASTGASVQCTLSQSTVKYIKLEEAKKISEGAVEA